jgi:cytochrome c553
MKGLIISIAAAALLLTTAIAGYSLTAGDGAVIYATDCASCHGAGDASNVKKANVAQINKAFRLHTSMKNSILSTNMGVTGAGLKGQFTLRQKNAIVANLKLWLGEDLYNAKFVNATSVTQSTWNCSYCHGPYDKTPLAGATNYNKIVRSFRQNKLRNNMMTPLKAKYKLSELQLIAKALAVAPPFSNNTGGGGGTTTIDGAKLYYIDCMPCHNGPISDVDQNSPDIETVYNAGSNGAAVIQNAINNPANNMNTTTLINLSPAEIQAIATAIQLDQKPLDTTIYSSLTCAGSALNPSCHNPDGSTPWNGN